MSHDALLMHYSLRACAVQAPQTVRLASPSQTRMVQPPSTTTVQVNNTLVPMWPRPPAVALRWQKALSCQILPCVSVHLCGTRLCWFPFLYFYKDPAILGLTHMAAIGSKATSSFKPELINVVWREPDRSPEHDAGFAWPCSTGVSR